MDRESWVHALKVWERGASSLFVKEPRGAVGDFAEDAKLQASGFGELLEHAPDPELHLALDNERDPTRAGLLEHVAAPSDLLGGRNEGTRVIFDDIL